MALVASAGCATPLPPRRSAIGTGDARSAPQARAAASTSEERTTRAALPPTPPAPPTPPTRPTLSDPGARAIEAVLSDLGQVVYSPRAGGGFTLGLASCDPTSAGEVGSFSVDIVEDAPRWAVGSAAFGAFTAPGREEAVFVMHGGCDPKHEGALLARRERGRWAVVRAEPIAGGRCFALADGAGRDSLVCVASRSGALATADVAVHVTLAEDGRPSRRQLLLELADGERARACPSSVFGGAARRRERFLEDAAIVPDDASGRDAVTVRIVLRSLPAEDRPDPWTLATMGRRDGEVTLRFLPGGAGLRPDAESARALAALCGLPAPAERARQ